MLQTHLLTTLKLSFHLKPLRPKWRACSCRTREVTAPSASPPGGDHLNRTMCDFHQHSAQDCSNLVFDGVTRSTAPPTTLWRKVLDYTTDKRNVPSSDRKLETFAASSPLNLSLLLLSFCHTSPPTLSLNGRPNLSPHDLSSSHHLQSIPPPARPGSLSSTTANRKKLRADP